MNGAPASRLGRRLDTIEARLAPGRAAVAVMTIYAGETIEEAEARHFASRPQDCSAALIVQVQRFAEPIGDCA